VVSALVFVVIATSLLLVLYLPQIHTSNGFPRIKYPTTGFWWSLFSLSWALLLIIPYLAYFLRANGWCAACCGGHQQYHLSSLFKSVIDEDPINDLPIHPGKKRPILSKKAKIILHLFMLIVGFVIVITSLICFVCFALIIKDPSGGAWAFITMLVGASYLAVIAFVFMQLQVRDKKREIVSSSPQIARRLLSDSEDSYGRRWGLISRGEVSNSDLDIPNASDSDLLLSDSDTKHILNTSILPETELRRTSHGRSPESEDDGDGLVAPNEDEDLLDLDENILASQLSGHAPFSLSKQSPDRSCRIMVQRALTVFGFVLMATLVILIFTFQLLACYQVISMAVDTHLVPPTGQFYAGSDIYPYKMHLYCQGATSSIITPTVIIETDWSSVSYEWSLVAKRIEEQNNRFRICLYDRAGYGWSDPGLKPRDAKVSANELNKILHDAKEFGPLVLVSNGYGSFISRVFAKLTDIPIMAMIMVDALHENEEVEYFKALDISNERGIAINDAESKNLFSKKFLAPIGINRIQIQTSSQLNALDQRRQLAAKGQLSYADTVWSEFDNIFGLSQQAVISSRGGIGFESLPLTLVVSEYRINGTCEQNRIPQDKCSSFLDARDDLGDLPMKLQQNLLTLSTNSKLIMAKHSSSYVHMEQPDFLAKVIIETASRGINITAI
jgi:pimeloyl-ACP methyl ester carboxylesterase